MAGVVLLEQPGEVAGAGLVVVVPEQEVRLSVKLSQSKVNSSQGRTQVKFSDSFTRKGNQDIFQIIYTRTIVASV